MSASGHESAGKRPRHARHNRPPLTQNSTPASHDAARPAAGRDHIQAMAGHADRPPAQYHGTFLYLFHLTLWAEALAARRGEQMPDREYYLHLAKLLMDLAESQDNAAVAELLLERANECMLLATATVEQPLQTPPSPVPQEQQQHAGKLKKENGE